MTKKILLLLLAHTGILLNVSISQDYINSTSKWCFSAGHSNIHTHKVYYEMSVESELLINDTSYYSMKSIGVDSVFSSGDIYSIDTIAFPTFFLRESDNKFYVRYSVSDDEVLYYNFDLEIGDTINTNYDPGQSEFDSVIIVTEIDTITSGELSRKIFFTNYDDIQLIEGVCNSRGWWMPYYSIDISLLENPTGLTSYSLDEETIQIDSSRVCIFNSISTETIDIDEQALIRVFPNPARNEINIDISLDMNTQLDIFIFNSIGQLMLIDKGEYRSQVKAIDVRNLEQGIYFLKIESKGNDNFFSTRFVLLD